MGYTTWFSGKLIPNKPFSKKFIKFINDFSETRHEPRDIEKLKAKDVNWAQNCLEGNMGPYGLYYVGPEDTCKGVIDFESIIDLNSYTPEELAEIRKKWTAPGYWCDWHINEKTGVVEWNDSEKFYNYIEWLKFLVDNFFEPAGYKLNGEIFWEGEEREDIGVIVVKDNNIYTYNGTTVYFNYDKENEKILANFSDRQLLDELIKRGIIS